jgi:hypothetical protein
MKRTQPRDLSATVNSWSVDDRAGSWPNTGEHP